MSDSTAAARLAVQAIIARDGLAQLTPEDVERLVGLYMEAGTDLAQLRAPEAMRAEPSIIFPAE